MVVEVSNDILQSENIANVINEINETNAHQNTIFASKVIKPQVEEIRASTSSDLQINNSTIVNKTITRNVIINYNFLQNMYDIIIGKFLPYKSSFLQLMSVNGYSLILKGNP